MTTTSTHYNPRRIAKNTAYLYVRMLLTVWLNLWATRLVLANLGVESMGVYNVVGSLIFFFSFVSIATTPTIQRFITFELGREDGDVPRVYSAAVSIVAALALVLLLLLGIVGEWVLRTFIVLPEGMLPAAVSVFRYSVLASLLLMLCIPLQAVIIAYERMSFFAIMAVVQVVLNWLAAYLIGFMAEGSRLLWYAILLLGANAAVLLAHWCYCRWQIPTARYRWRWDKALFRDMLSFTGYTTASNALYVAYSEGLVLVINLTFGTAVNAVYTIAIQLKNTITSFGMNIFKAASPQVTKTYADGDLERHQQLVYASCKAELFMILLLAIPCFIKADYVLHLWLGDVPPYTVEFVRCILLLGISYALSEPFRTAVYATRRIRRFLIVPEAVYLLTVLPLCYLVSRLTGSPVAMVVCMVVVDLSVCALRIWLATKVTVLRVGDTLRQVLLPVGMVLLLSASCCWGMAQLTADTLPGLLLCLAVHALLFIAIVYVVGLTVGERTFVRSMIGHRFCHHKS